MNENPLLDCKPYPKFDLIKPEHILPALSQVLTGNRETITQLCENEVKPTWDNFVEPLEAIDDQLEQLWSPVSHLNSIKNTDELRQVVQDALPILSDYSAEVGQNKALFKRFEALAGSTDFGHLNAAQKTVITNQLRDFKLSGIGLSKAQQADYKKLSSALSKLSNQFQQNVLDATQAWTLIITDPADLAGLPDSAISAAKSLAEQSDKEGWQFNLQAPSFIPFLTYAENRTLRKEMYTAYSTRASDQGPHAGKWDNSKVMRKLIKKRHKLAKLLGFDHYAAYSLETKMAKDVNEVESFLLELAQHSKAAAKKEDDELKAFAQQLDGIDQLEAWDRGYYAEKLKQQVFQFSEEELRAYFPLPKVLSGLFTVVEKLFSIHVREAVKPAVWHEDVHFFEIVDSGGELLGSFYLDLVARENKNGGAWMATCTNRRVTETLNQKPVAFLNCNFSAPEEGKPSLLRHDDVITLFHEFGHGLHHMLTQVDIASVAGINGVPWDAVELPSQFLENWCWQREALDFISGHVESGESLPDKLLDKMLKAKHFHAALQMLRQVEFSLFDIRLHAGDDKVDVQATLDEVRAQVSVTETPTFNRFAHGFSHIFSGGYSAGYYSYKWAEVLSADAFSRFEDEGLFNEQAGRDFLENILQKGGSEPPAKLFAQFRGREPSIEPLLRHCGLN